MTPEMEVAVMRDSEEALRELVQAFKNIGLPPASIVLMLGAMIEEVKLSVN